MTDRNLEVKRFPDKSYVIHSITGHWQGTCSAWFDSQGVLQDAEHFYTFAKSRDIKKDGPIWNTIQGIGKAYREPSIDSIPEKKSVDTF